MIRSSAFGVQFSQQYLVLSSRLENIVKELFFSVFSCLINVLIGNKCPIFSLICLSLIFSLRNYERVYDVRNSQKTFISTVEKHALFMLSFNFLSESTKIFYLKLVVWVVSINENDCSVYCSGLFFSHWLPPTTLLSLQACIHSSHILSSFSASRGYY